MEDNPLPCWDHIMVMSSGGHAWATLPEEPISGEKRSRLETFLRGDNAQFVSWFTGLQDMEDEQQPVEENLGLKTFDQFSMVFAELACNDWSRTTAGGELYGGPWKQPEGSVQYKNAGALCFKENATALWNVATEYTSEAVLYSVNYLCLYRAHGAPQVRDLCQWVLARMLVLENWSDFLLPLSENDNSTLVLTPSFSHSPTRTPM